MSEEVFSKAITVATTATQLVGANKGSGRTVLIQNNDASADLYVGGKDVTTSNGLKIAAGATMPISTGNALYGIVASSTLNARRLEVYP